MPRASSTSRTEIPRRRGRPAEFDRQEALDAALETFWRRGFSGASLEHLTEAMDLNKPSIYAAFGNKQRLYDASIDHYVGKIGASYLAPLAAPRLRAALNGFYDATIDGITGKHGPRGCIVACTLPAEAGVSTAARAKLAAVLAQLDAAVVARLVAAQAAGEIAKRRRVQVLAQIVTSGMVALSIRARAGASKGELRRLADEFVAAVVGA